MASPSFTNLTSILNTLHSHLQSQTQLLPTLHAQLGLPDTALKDELQALQTQLMHAVEAQIDSRRRQVEEWLMRCEDVEQACIRYTTALGGNVKMTGSSVGELRKERVLPRRYELVSEHQEKLRQVYHTKLEQLTTLTKRLNKLASTLGPDFFARDIVEATAAAGEDTSDPTSNKDVTPERFSRLEKELVRGKGEVAKRLQQLSETFVQIDWLYGELGIPPPALDDLPSPSSSASMLGAPSCALPRPGSSCSISTNTSDPFAISTPTPSSRSTQPSAPLISHDEPNAHFQHIFARFVVRVEQADAETGPSAGLEGVEPTPALLAWAGRTHDMLVDTKRQREARIQALYDQLEGLWKRLGVAPEDMDAFVEAHRGSTTAVVAEYEAELERMLDLKREMMSTFVESAREEIVKLWEEMMIGEDERADFAPFADDEHTEELLLIHEDEIKRLKDERRVKAPLLAGIRKYFEICAEERQLAAAANDQSRLTGRGPRDPGRLLREEKMRKRVAKEKPRLEQDLLASIPAWEEEAGRAFFVHGESILQILREAVGANDQENNNQKRRGVTPQGRAGSVPPRSTTPLGSFAPGRSTNTVTPAVRPLAGHAGAQSAPNKRPRLGETTNHGSSYSVNKHVHSSPTKAGGSSLPRPVALPVTRPGALGHGRVPSSGAYAAYQARSASASTRSYGAPAASAVVRKASRARKESFKPRPSIDEGVAHGHGLGGRYGGFGVSVKEEDEGY